MNDDNATQNKIKLHIELPNFEPCEFENFERLKPRIQYRYLTGINYSRKKGSNHFLEILW
jgi:hypothetical protein